MKVAALGLALTLACASAQVNRPQTPQPPFPYRSLDVIVPSKAPGIRLACTLTMPDDDGPHRAMLVLAGSGPQDRDGNVFGHKPLLVMADYLTRRGTTVLRCDDRGTGNSTGRFLGSTTADFSLDAEGAFEYLSKRPGVTKAGIGGQSEGALIAAMVASRRQSAGFIVMLAGPGVKGETLGYAQAEAIQRAQKLPEDYIRSHRKMMAEMIALARTGATETQLLRHARVKFATIPDAELIARLLSDRWHRAAVDYDPTPMLTKVKCPVLVLNGDLDLQVVADLNVPAIQAALRKAGNERVTVRRFPNLNHLFQTATTGLPQEYARIEETMAPIVLQTIAAWLEEDGRY